jgi:beta-galactosidase
MYPTKRFDQEQRLMEHVLRHYRVQNAMGCNEYISGAIGWCAFDYNTHYDFGSGDRICYHGVMDMFRIPKFSSYVYSSQVDSEKEVVLEPVTLWSRGERNIGGVIPLVICTNCEYVKVFVGNTQLGGNYYPDCEAYQGLLHPPVIIKKMPGEWGCAWYDVKFIGYINDEPVITKKFPKDPIASQLVAISDDEILQSGEMDATRIVYKMVDQCGNILPYINEFIKLSVDGPAEIIGPKEVAFIGGGIAVWIKTTGETGKVTISAKGSRFAAEDIQIEII